MQNMRTNQARAALGAWVTFCVTLNLDPNVPERITAVCECSAKRRLSERRKKSRKNQHMPWRGMNWTALQILPQHPKKSAVAKSAYWTVLKSSTKSAALMIVSGRGAFAFAFLAPL